MNNGKILVSFATAIILHRKIQVCNMRYIQITITITVPYFREYFPPLNSFPTLMRKLLKFSLHKKKINAETTYMKFSRFYHFKKE